MKRILFVDDEPRVLEGLRRSLRPMRQEWDMEFAASGRAALEYLSHDTFDLVVSDMRMPDMDGAELLAEVRRRSPRSVRIILTGQCDHEASLRAVRVAHRQLSKPCDPETIKATVQQACKLRELLSSDALRALISKQESVPSLPSLYIEVVNELDSIEPSMSKVGALIAKDIGMTAKIMQVVNSAFFGLRSHVSSPEQAVMLLGLDTVQALVLAASIFSRFVPAVLKPLSIDVLWTQSQRVSTLSARIAKAEQADQKFTEYASLAGLLHDTGILLLANHSPGMYQDVEAAILGQAMPLREAELRVINATHSQVGAYLLGIWGLPDVVVEAVAWHHCPGECPAPHFSPLSVVHVASTLVQEMTFGYCGETPTPIDEEYLRQLGKLDRLPIWRKLCEECCRT